LTTTEVPVFERILKANDYIAEENQKLFNEKHVFVCGIIGSPGTGKTALLERTVPILKEKGQHTAVLVGDIATTRDAERLKKFNIPSIQLTTGGACHLEAQQVHEAVKALNLDEIDFLFIENVGNLICPSSYDLGEHLRIVMLSVPEGDDKVEKYMSTFRRAQLVILNKIDLLNSLEFDVEKVKQEAKALQPNVEWMELSCKSGEGIETWIKLLESKHSL
jgi:hydrogenase nickel incorporation protein HypB